MHPLLQSQGKRSRTGQVIRCPQCQSEFYVSPCLVGRRVYCSRACQNQAQERQVERICPTCGETYRRSPSMVGRYCSRVCYEKTKTRRPAGSCEVCSGSLPVNRIRFCSWTCYRTGIRKGDLVPCEVCGKSMYVEPHLKGRRRFCSQACKHQADRIDGPGCRCRRSDGYMQVYYPTHPDASASGFILEHRLVMEQTIGRRLLRSEHVHHKNGVRDDNRIENLQLIEAGDHARVSVEQGVKKRRRMRDELAEYRRRFGPLES